MAEIDINTSSENDNLSNRTVEFCRSWKKKLEHLSDSVSRSGVEGASFWLKSHNQIDTLNEAIEELIISSQSENFTFLNVSTTFSSFVLPEEDKGQAEWYQTAHNYLKGFEQKLTDRNEYDLELMQLALKELQFICESTAFHERYGIESIQHKVTKVYAELQKSIKEFNSTNKVIMSKKIEEDRLKVAHLETQKTQAQAKIEMAKNARVKEMRLAAVEEKKKMVAKRELIQAQKLQELDNSKLAAKQAEVDRQTNLQDSYVQLQIEEAMTRLSIDQIINIFTRRLKTEQNSPQQQNKLKLFAKHIISIKG